jgi:hypothetical protein
MVVTGTGAEFAVTNEEKIVEVEVLNVVTVVIIVVLVIVALVDVRVESMPLDCSIGNISVVVGTSMPHCEDVPVVVLVNNWSCEPLRVSVSVGTEVSQGGLGLGVFAFIVPLGEMVVTEE